MTERSVDKKTQVEEALKLTLEALEEIHPGNMTPMAEGNWNKAIAAIREALAEQPAQHQEPVACVHIKDGCLVGSHRDGSKLFPDGQYGLWPIDNSPAQAQTNETHEGDGMNTNNGGPAFPGPYANEQGNIEVLWKQQGMTLRDYFAAKAMQGIFASNAEHEHDDSDIFDAVAEAAYKQADAMLKARDE